MTQLVSDPETDAPEGAPHAAQPKRRGRPRNEGLRRTILRAAAELLEERGLDGVTIEAIAERAGVGKQTIYRRWSSRAAVLVEAFLSQDDIAPGAPDTGTLRRDLTLYITAVCTTAGHDGLSRSVAGLVSTSHMDPEVARLFRERFVAPARATVREMLQRGVERGEVHPDVDLEVVIDELLGAIWYRALLSGGRAGSGYAEALAATLMHGFQAKDAGRVSEPRRGRKDPADTMDLFNA